MAVNEKTVYDALESIGIPCAYYAFPEGQAPELPYICYFATGTDNFAADGHVYLKVTQLSIELYTKNKDFDMEQRVENALNNYVWNKEGEQNIDSENCYYVVYTLEV